MIVLWWPERQKGRKNFNLTIWKKGRRKGLCFGDCLKKERKGEFYIDISKEKKGEMYFNFNEKKERYYFDASKQRKEKCNLTVKKSKEMKEGGILLWRFEKMKDLVLTFRWKEE